MKTQPDRHLTPPSYRRQRRRSAADLAFVETSAGRRYLGPYGSPESHEAYQRFLAEWRASRGGVTTSSRAPKVLHLLGQFQRHAEAYYRGPDGKPGKEYENHLPAMKILRDVCGRVRVAQFTPKHLKAVRQAMIDRGWSRRHINRQVVRLRSIFKWGVSEGLVPVEVHQALATLPGLRAGRCEAAESEPVRPVRKEQVKAVLPHVSRVVRDMIRLQWHTGMRPGEVCVMRAIDIDTTGETWLYRPSRHKTMYRGRERVVALGPKAKAIVERYLGRRPVDAFLFSPKDADRQRRSKLAADRVTPLSCGNRAGTNRRQQPAKEPGGRYTPRSYGRAIAYGCERAWPHVELSRIKRGQLTPEQKAQLRRWNGEHRWTPNQIRHAAATRIRKVAGLEMARVILGHSTMAVTETYYAEADLGKAARLMAKIG
jgi:integrase